MQNTIRRIKARAFVYILIYSTSTIQFTFSVYLKTVILQKKKNTYSPCPMISNILEERNICSVDPEKTKNLKGSLCIYTV